MEDDETEIQCQCKFKGIRNHQFRRASKSRSPLESFAWDALRFSCSFAHSTDNAYIHMTTALLRTEPSFSRPGIVEGFL